MTSSIAEKRSICDLWAAEKRSGNRNCANAFTKPGTVSAVSKTQNYYSYHKILADMILEHLMAEVVFVLRGANGSDVFSK